MRRQLLATAVGGIALMSGYGAATGQVAFEVPGVGLYIGPTYHDDYYDYRHDRSHYGVVREKRVLRALGLKRGGGAWVRGRRRASPERGTKEDAGTT